MARTRTAILGADSALRRSGFYAGLTVEEMEATGTSQMLVCVGFCFYLWLAMFSLSFQLASVDAQRRDGWTLQLTIRLRNRVPLDSPLMKASARGDVVSIRQLLKDKKGGVNDRAMCSGKTALLVSSIASGPTHAIILISAGCDRRRALCGCRMSIRARRRS